jgi:hypothetical protein
MVKSYQTTQLIDEKRAMIIGTGAISFLLMLELENKFLGCYS